MSMLNTRSTVTSIRSPFIQSVYPPLKKNTVFLKKKKNKPVRITSVFNKRLTAEVAGAVVQNGSQIMSMLTTRSTVTSIRSPFIQPVYPLKKNTVFLKKNNKPVQITCFNKRFTAEVAGEVIQNGSQIVLSSLQKLIGNVSTAIHHAELKVAIYNTGMKVAEWAFKTGISQIKDRVHFDLGDIVQIKDKDAVVTSIGATSIVLTTLKGPIVVENTVKGLSKITNLTRDIDTITGDCKVFRFHVEYDFKTNQIDIYADIEEYMKTNGFLKDQKFYNTVIPHRNNKVQVIGYVKIPDDVKAHELFVKYTEIKGGILAELSQLIDKKKPIVNCDVCQKKILSAATVMALIGKGFIQERSNS